jgi:hypothetical protein
MLSDLYILQKPRPKAEGGGLLPLGSRADIVKFFLALNTAADREGVDILYGPGIRIELPPNQDPVLQITVNVTEDELFHILFFGTAQEPTGRMLRAATERGWRFFDPVRAEYVPRWHDGDDDEFEDPYRSDDDDD